MSQKQLQTEEDRQRVNEGTKTPFQSVLFIVSIAFGITILLTLLSSLILQARESARQVQSRNNLKQIGIALHNYHDVHNLLPPGGTIRQDGLPHHGWMTSILPYLDSSPIYSMIDFNNEWNHPFNADLFTDQHPTFNNPSVPMELLSNVVF